MKSVLFGVLMAFLLTGGAWSYGENDFSSITYFDGWQTCGEFVSNMRKKGVTKEDKD
jgi:hypothetical protein